MSSYHTIDTEGDAATDDLDTINGGTVGQLLILRSADSARDVTLKDDTGNLRLAGDFTLKTTDDRIALMYDGTNWVEVNRSDNAVTASDHGILTGLGDDDHPHYRLESADHSHLTAGLQGGLVPGADSTAIHDDTASEISAITEKGSPVGADLILIEDSAAGNAKKKVQITNLPAGSDADAIHDNVAAEISAITAKATPVGADFILIEDSAAGDAKKSMTVAALEAVLSHDNIAGVSADDHHPQAHTVVSHSDTTATGAELETLTDGSNADALHAHAYAWTTWAPTYTNLTIGNGTVIARYSKVGSTVTAVWEFTLGSSSAVGTNPIISLPLTAALNETVTRFHYGQGYLLVSGAFPCFVRFQSSTTFSFSVIVTNATFASNTNITATIPGTWADGDVMGGTFTYEAA